MNPSLDYLICAAGDGTRLKDAVPHLAKPLIQMNAQTLLERSVDSLDLFPGDRLVFIVQKAHGIRTVLEGLFASKYPRVETKWLELTGPTSGQLATALAAREFLRPSHPVVIFNSDTYFRSRETIKLLGDPKVDGIVPCSEEKGDEWSFCEAGADGLVTRVAEKVRISSLASVGYYYFGSSNMFLKYADLEIVQPSQPSKENYVAPIYSRLIADGKKVYAPKVDCFMPMGTLAQLQTYWKTDKEDLIAQNGRGVLVVDLDGTITVDDASIPYSERLPNTALIQKLREWHESGFEIIIHTARRMKTHSADESRVIADIGQITMDWLKKHSVPYNGLKFGKPNSHDGFYIDDRAIRPSEFVKLSREEIFALLRKKD